MSSDELNAEVILWWTGIPYRRDWNFCSRFFLPANRDKLRPDEPFRSDADVTVVNHFGNFLAATPAVYHKQFHRFIWRDVSNKWHQQDSADVACLWLGTKSKARHDVIYVDKLTYCIQDTPLSIRWWSVMWHDSQSCYRVLSIRQYKGLVAFGIIPSCFHHHSEYISWRKHFPLPPLPYRHFWDRHLCYVFSLTSVGRLFRPTLAENDNLIIMDIVIN